MQATQTLSVAATDVPLSEYIVHSQLARVYARDAYTHGNFEKAKQLLIDSFIYARTQLYEAYRTCEVLHTLKAPDASLDLIHRAKESYNDTSYLFELEYMVDFLKEKHPDARDLISFFEAKLIDKRASFLCEKPHA